MWIELQWWRARWAVGVSRIIMDGLQPARVPDGVIDALRKREKNGFVMLPPPPTLRRGDRVRILRGPFADHLAVYAGMRAHERVEVLLQLLGGMQAVTMARRDIKALS